MYSVVLVTMMTAGTAAPAGNYGYGIVGVNLSGVIGINCMGCGGPPRCSGP